MTAQVNQIDLSFFPLFGDKKRQYEMRKKNGNGAEDYFCK